MIPRHMMMGWAAAGLILSSSAALGAQDCAQGRKDLATAKDRITASADDEATVLLNQSIDECPTYEAYETLAEHLAVSDSPRDHSSAVDAFLAANTRAPSPKDRAQTLFQYGALLNRTGDPENAYPLVQYASTLDPNRAAIKSLAAEVRLEIQHPTTEVITRALHYSLAKPVKGVPGASEGKALHIEINFDTAKTTPDDKTLPNIEILAEGMSVVPPEEHFVIVGHADHRGDDAYNVELSRQRAEEIKNEIVQMKPELKGRIAVIGRGSKEPINPGDDEDALRANRRVQVYEK
jgi:outer membrane protein OmpA-like peptidoglycan-associated protein